MSTIGQFRRDPKADTYSGEIVTLTFSRQDVQFTLNEKSGEKEPDYRVVGKTLHGPVEFGAAWKRTSEKGQAYLSVTLDDPTLSGTLNAALFDVAGSDTATLVWTRSKATKPKNA